MSRLVQVWDWDCAVEPVMPVLRNLLGSIPMLSTIVGNKLQSIDGHVFFGEDMLKLAHQRLQAVSIAREATVNGIADVGRLIRLK